MQEHEVSVQPQNGLVLNLSRAGLPEENENLKQEEPIEGKIEGKQFYFKSQVDQEPIHLQVGDQSPGDLNDYNAVIYSHFSKDSFPCEITKPAEASTSEFSIDYSDVEGSDPSSQEQIKHESYTNATQEVPMPLSSSREQEESSDEVFEENSSLVRESLMQQGSLSQ